MNTVAFMANGPTAGKSTAAGLMASILAEKEVKTVVVPFAKPVKDIATQMGWDGLKDDKGRTLLEDVGMGGRRYFPDTWVNLWSQSVLDMWTEDRNLVVLSDDCRFPNEVERIKRFGGILIKIKKEGVERSDLVSEQYQPQDSMFDYVIENNGTMKELENELRKIVEEQWPTEEEDE